MLFLLFLTAGGKSHGVDGKSGAFFRHARRSGLWPEAEAVHRSAVTKARAKRSWTAFARRHRAAVRLAYAVWPASEEDPWPGLPVFAIDGSQYALPASTALRAAFDPDSGLDQPGQGHYPQGLVSTVQEVFRRLPMARTVRPLADANEREALKARLPPMPAGGVLRCDRGSPSYALLDVVQRHYQGYWRFRGPAQSTFPAVEQFMQSGREDALLRWQPPQGAALTVRAIRLPSPAGTRSVLLTNLLEAPRFTAAALIARYFRRWAVETQYRDENTSLDSETVHSHTENGIRQELFAILLVAVIARLLRVLMTDRDHPSGVEPPLKQAMITVATEAAVLTPHCPIWALAIFTELLNEIARVRYYPPKTSRPSQPRVSRQPISKWQISKTKRLMNA